MEATKRFSSEGERKLKNWFWSNLIWNWPKSNKYENNLTPLFAQSFLFPVSFVNLSILKETEICKKFDYWLNHWHILLSKGTSGFTSNTLLIRIQYCYQFKYFTDLIKVMRRMVKWNLKWNIYCKLRNCKVHKRNSK